jgi:hypothetical protein
MTINTSAGRRARSGALALSLAWAAVHCSSTNGSGSAQGIDASTAEAAASSSGGSSSGGSSSGSSSGASGNDAGAGTPEAGVDGSGAPLDAGLPAIDGSVRACTPMLSPNLTQARAGECDYLLQSIDFEDKLGFPSPPGSIKVTNFGSALGAYGINDCGPYCYAKNFTINVDIVGGGAQAQEQGEVIFEFPTTGPGLPIATAVGRDCLAWILLDGPTMPAFKITGQLVLETTTGTVTGPDIKPLAYQNWLLWQQAEFKYFGIKATTFSAAPVNVTGIGFRIAGPANLPAGQEWHGVAYIDHLEIRESAAPDNPTDAGAYPFGL